jgi:hypothetical protein
MNFTFLHAADLHLGSPFTGLSLRDEKLASRFAAASRDKSDGDVGTSLFAAASGLRGLAELRRELEEEAGEIFAPRASRDRRFYQVLARFEDARKAIHDRELRAGDWKKLNERIDELSRRLAEIKSLRGSKAAARASLARSKRVAPLIRLIDDSQAQLRELDTLPDVPFGFGQQLSEVLQTVHSTAEKKRVIAEREAKLGREHDSIAVDEVLLAHASGVLSLFAETGAYASQRRDLPRIQAEADEYRGNLAELAIRLGMPDERAVEATQPSDVDLALVRTLISEGRDLFDTKFRPPDIA